MHSRKDNMIHAPFRLVKLSELTATETEYFRKPPGEEVRRAFACATNTAIEEVRAAFMFELPDYPIAREYQRWIEGNLTSMQKIGIHLVPREVFVNKRGEGGLLRAITSMIQEGRPEHCVWILYEQASLQPAEAPDSGGV